jgi:cell division protein FtsA
MKSGACRYRGAEEMLRLAVDRAERAAGVHVDSVVLPITAGRTASELFAATVHMKNPTVSDADIERVLAAGSHHSVREGRAVLHSLPIGYALDESRGIRDPRGMVGQRLGVDMHVATTDVAAARNLTLLVERAISASRPMVAAPYVSGLAVLAEDEADLGAAVIDLGAGTTTLAVFAEGRFVHVDGFTVGGHHVTMDIARGLTTTIADAERLKTLFGAALSGPSDDRDMISLSAIDADPRDPPRMIPRSQLVRIIRPRVEKSSRWCATSCTLRLRFRSARARDPGRRCEPDDRFVRSRDANSRPAGAHRPPARHRRPDGRHQGAGICDRGRAPGLSPVCVSRTLRTAKNAAIDDRD